VRDGGDETLVVSVQLLQRIGLKFELKDTTLSWSNRVLPEQIAASAAGLQDDLAADKVTSRGFLL